MKTYVKRVPLDWTVLESLTQPQLRFVTALMQRMEYKEKQVNNINSVLEMLEPKLNETLVSPNNKA
jgi:hypothetical protein